MKYSIEQNAVRLHRDGHALVSAAPGSGKTTTLAGLIMALLEDGVRPEHMLILMFNKDAKEHFSNKLVKLVADLPHVDSIPEVKTYHSLGNAITKAMVKRGVLPNYKLETSSKRQEMIGLNVIRQLVSPEKLKELQNKSSKIVDTFISFIEMTKSMMLPPSEVFDALAVDKELKFFIEGFDLFEETRKNEKVRFFTDLIYDPLMAIRANPELKSWLGDKKAYVICDEFQDSDPMQYELLEIIAGSTANVVACGDIDQSIYTFRGADPELMMYQFSKSFPNPTIYNLSQTFRYGDELAMAANNLIINNKCRYDSLCVANENNAETSIALNMVMGGYGNETVKVVNELRESGAQYNDMSILVRLYSVAIPIELAFLQNNIPVRMESGRSCFNTSEFRAMENILKLASGTLETYTAKEKRSVYESLLKYPHAGFNADTMESMLKYVESSNCLLSECLQYGLDSAKLHPFVKKKISERIEIVELIERQSKKKQNLRLSSHTLLSMYAKETDLSAGLSYIALSDLELKEIIERNAAIMKFFRSNDKEPIEMLSYLNELKNTANKPAQSDAVVITSVHKAKGLEWPYVIVPGVEVGMWPYESPSGSGTDIESERRLLYVAITRAMKKTFVLAPKDPKLIKYVTTGAKPMMKSLLPANASCFVYELGLFDTKLWVDSKMANMRTPLFKRYDTEKKALCA
ncbi:ATP-dependent helicase [Vibrio harveyi]|uniref:ATP-dependent helicase n=1 Tax=Vibrio harveyi TaxID=669 RepID=UPI003CF152DF